MTPGLRKLAADMLDKAGGEFANHGCNDWEWPAHLSAEDRQTIAIGAHARGRPDDEMHAVDGDYGPSDWCVMYVLAKMLREEAAK